MYYIWNFIPGNFRDAKLFLDIIEGDRHGVSNRAEYY